MKLSISNIAWSAEKDTEMYHFLQELGFKGLEIAPTRIFPEAPYEKIEDAKEWAHSLKKDYNLVIPSMQSIWYGHSEKIFGTNEERKILIDYTRKAIDFAEAIGCRNLVFGNPKNRDTEDVKSAMPTAINFFREIGDYAAAHNTIIALEANPTVYNTRFLNYTEQAVDFVDQVNSEGIKVNVDLGTIINNVEDIYYLLQIPEYISHVHISEPKLMPIEKRVLHKQLFAILREIDYDKFVSLEMGNKGDLGQVQDIMKYIISLTV